MSKCSIIKEIKRAEESIQSCYQRVTDLEERLKTKQLPTEQKTNIEHELQELRKLLATNEEQLLKLHGENRRSFALAASIFFLIFLLYGLYVMFIGTEL